MTPEKSVRDCSGTDGQIPVLHRPTAMQGSLDRCLDIPGPPTRIGNIHPGTYQGYRIKGQTPPEVPARGRTIHDSAS